MSRRFPTPEDDPPDGWELTPDAMLADIRFYIRQWCRSGYLSNDQVGQFVETVDNLDEHLSHHGDYPICWRRGIPPERFRRVENVPTRGLL